MALRRYLSSLGPNLPTHVLETPGVLLSFASLAFYHEDAPLINPVSAMCVLDNLLFSSRRKGPATRESLVRDCPTPESPPPTLEEPDSFLSTFNAACDEVDMNRSWTFRDFRRFAGNLPDWLVGQCLGNAFDGVLLKGKDEKDALATAWRQWEVCEKGYWKDG